MSSFFYIRPVFSETSKQHIKGGIVSSQPLERSRVMAPLKATHSLLEFHCNAHAAMSKLTKKLMGEKISKMYLPTLMRSHPVNFNRFMSFYGLYLHPVICSSDPFYPRFEWSMSVRCLSKSFGFFFCLTGLPTMVKHSGHFRFGHVAQSSMRLWACRWMRISTQKFPVYFSHGDPYICYFINPSGAHRCERICSLNGMASLGSFNEGSLQVIVTWQSPDSSGGVKVWWQVLCHILPDYIIMIYGLSSRTYTLRCMHACEFLCLAVHSWEQSS